MDGSGAAAGTGRLQAGLWTQGVGCLALTACVIIGGLAPILWSQGTGADVMKRIATPMVGGVFTSTIMELLVYPAIYFLWRSRSLKRLQSNGTADVEPVLNPIQA